MTEDHTTTEHVDVDAQRQAEIDALAAQLASAAAGEPAVTAPRKRASRRVTAKNPAEFIPTEAPEPASVNPDASEAIEAQAPAAEDAPSAESDDEDDE